MIISFAVTNYGPFKESAELSMKGSIYDEHPENVIKTTANEDGLLTSAIIYGPNASGKSSFINALKTLQDIVKNHKLPSACYNPHVTEIGKPTSMEIKMYINEVLYHYFISYNAEKIVEEYLYHSPCGRRGLIFHRKSDGEYEFGRTVMKGQKSISYRTLEDMSYLYAAGIGKNEFCYTVRNEIVNNMFFINGVSSDVSDALEILNDEGIKSRTIKSLKDLGLGIVDLEIGIKGGELNLDNGFSDIEEKREIKFGREYNDSVKYFPVKYISAGTLVCLNILCNSFKAMDNGGLVIIDNFSSLLHPEVAKYIISLFNTKNNVNNAQMIANSNDQIIMDTEEVFRRDQIFFIDNNNPDVGSKFYALSGFNGVKKYYEIRKGYATDRYGALPRINKL